MKNMNDMSMFELLQVAYSVLDELKRRASDDNGNVSNEIPMESLDNIPVDNGRVNEPSGYPAMCSECKQPCTVPFKPDLSRPVKCKDCYYGERK